MCIGMNIAPVAGLSPRALKAYLRFPDLGLRTDRAAIDKALAVGPSSVTRYLQELSSWGLILHVAHGDYAVPRVTVRRLLLIEPDPYHRELIILDDAYRDEPGRAFACLPVRDALSMELLHAILVLPPGSRHDHEPPQLAEMPLVEGPRSMDVAIPSDASPPVAVVRLATAAPLDALALLASTGDADFVIAARKAAPRLGTDVAALAAAVRRLKVAQSDGADAPFSNLVRHPAWLAARVRAAGVAAIRRTTRAAVERGGVP